MSIWFGFAPTAIAEHVNFSNDFFTSVLAPIGMAQTLVSRTTWYVAKERTVVKRIGTPTCPLICLVRRREFTRIWNAPSFQRVKHARGSGTCACGQTRISMGAFWSIPAGQAKPMLNIFRALVFNALVSGMEILVLSLGRKQLRGAVCKKNTDASGEKTYRSLTNAQVLEKTSFRTTLSLELRIRRLRYNQQLARRPANHRQVFAAMFGQYPFESEPTIAPDGTVHESNPWLDQFIEDMEDLLYLDSAAELLYGLSSRQPLALFQEFCAAFCQVDPTELRVRILSVRIPPPGYVPPALLHPPLVPAVLDP